MELSADTRKHGAFVVFAAGVLLHFLVFPAVSFAAFGVSPPFVNADHLVAGATYAQTIYLVQDQPNEDLTIVTNVDVPERVRPWLSFEPGEEFVIPKGVRQFPVKIIVKVPQGIDLGSYSGSVSFTGKPAQQGQVTIALGVQVNINLTIGDDVYRKVNIPVIRLLDIEEGWDPRVYVKFENEGNVPEAFDGATYELYDQFGSVRLAFMQIRDRKQFPEVEPFTVKEFTIDFPTEFHLGIGQYWGTVSFMQEGRSVASQRTVFTALKKGSLSSPSAAIIAALREHWPYVAGGGGLFLATVVLGFWLKRQRRARTA